MQIESSSCLQSSSTTKTLIKRCHSWQVPMLTNTEEMTLSCAPSLDSLPWPLALSRAGLNNNRTLSPNKNRILIWIKERAETSTQMERCSNGSRKVCFKRLIWAQTHPPDNQAISTLASSTMNSQMATTRRSLCRARKTFILMIAI